MAHQIMTAETIEHVAQLFEEHGSIVWWQRDAKDLLPEGFTHQVHQMVSSKRNRYQGCLV